ncbi:hypothetical protein [Caballeronia sp. DA-9]|uniref:hypothetical protein n=1 Tax=Caballeronia sp. DA-9 TaxID=3436237 RepID=UPI003F663355
MLKFTNTYGVERSANMRLLGAMEGCEFRREFSTFLASGDPVSRRKFVDKVFANISIVMGNGSEFALRTNALIVNHVGEGSDAVPLLRDLFDAFMRENEFEPQACASRVGFWSEVGSRAAETFLVEGIGALLDA